MPHVAGGKFLHEETLRIEIPSTHSVRITSIGSMSANYNDAAMRVVPDANEDYEGFP
jgi:hypothetical protein